MHVNHVIFSFVTMRYLKLYATAWLWSTQTQAEESTVCNATLLNVCVSPTTKPLQFYGRSFAFRNFFFFIQNVCSCCANVSLGIVNPAQDNSVVYSTRGLFFVDFILPTLKMLQTWFSMTFPDLQRQMGWCQRCFTKMSLKPQTRRQDSQQGEPKVARGGHIF